MLDHEKWCRAIRKGGDGALLVWWRLAAWSSRRLSDGRVPGDMVEEVARLYGSKTRAKALSALVEARLVAWYDPAEDSSGVRRGLVEPSTRARRDGDELVIVGYLKRNPSREKVEQELERKAKAQRDYEDRKRLTASVTNQEPISVRPTRSDPENVPSPPLPSPPSTTTERARTDATSLHHEAPSAAPDTSSAVLKEIPVDYELDDELRSEAIAAGVPPITIDDRFNDLKRGPIGGQRGIFARELRNYIRRQFPKWRTWNETDSAKRHARAGPHRRDVPNQPNAGVTGLEKAQVIR